MIEPRKDWKLLGRGRHRCVYLLPSGNVIKIPRNDAGKVANVWEAIVWRFRNEREKLPSFIFNCMKKTVPAHCRLIPGTKILVMEFVKSCSPTSKSPAWAQKIDNGQIGMTNKGRLVAYDFADFWDADLKKAQLAVQELSQRG